MLYRITEVPATRSSRAASKIRTLHSTPRRRQQESIPGRYGPANEPPPYLGGGTGIGPPSKNAQEELKKKAFPKIGEKLQKRGEEQAEVQSQAERVDSQETKEASKRTDPATVDGATTRAFQGDPMLDAAESPPYEQPPGAPRPLDEKPMESVLDAVPDPTQHEQASSKPSPEEEHPDISHDEHSPPVRAPHIETPRYVHHFDTYGLVKRLLDAGWSDAQAITIMKAMRLILADNMELAKEALVSKSMVENETYLFRAACAELKTEVTSRRKGEQEKMRAERTHLQHEVDILNQRVSQESAHLKDELKGMFDDRKMAVRNEQRGMESKVQQLGYKITVSLQADAKSDVEGLRWIMTRRVIIALASVVVMVLGGLKLISNTMHEKELAEKKPQTRSTSSQTEGRAGEMYVGDGGGEVGGRGFNGPGDVVLKDGSNPDLVSLG